MRISVGQILMLLAISFLLFGDVDNLKKKLRNFPRKIKTLLEERRTRKKGT